MSQRRHLRQGALGQPAEVGQPARGAHRLHLRRARRGAGADRHAARAGPLRRHRVRRASGWRINTSDPFVRYVDRGCHDLVDGPDDHQHRHGAGPAAGDRHSAAPRLLRRVGAGAFAWWLSGCSSASPAPNPRQPRHCVNAGVNAAAAARTRREAPSPGRSRRKRPVEARLMVESSAPRRVLLAGGGSAGHTSPLLATADALRRQGTRDRDHRPRHRPGSGDAGDPRGWLPTRADPARSAPASPGSRAAANPRSAAWCLRGSGSRCSTGSSRTWWSGFGGYVSVPAYLAARRRGCPSSCTRATHCRGSANKLGALLTPHVATSFPDTELRACALRRAADPPDDQHPRPSGAASRGA